MKPKLLCLLLLSAFLLPYFSPLFGNDQFLDSCLKITEARDKRLVVAREQLKLTKIRIARTARAFFPGIAIERQVSRGKTIVDEYQSEEVGVRASQPIYEGGRQTASYRYECLMDQAARYNYTKTREEVFARIKLAYYELLSLKMEYVTLKKAYNDIDKLQDKVTNEYRAKAISELDLIEAQNFRDKVENLFKGAEMNLELANKKLMMLVGVSSLDNIPVLIPEGLTDDVPEISFTLKECLGFLGTNNVDLKIAQAQMQMADQKKIIVRSKVIPKIYVDGFYGSSGEAFVTEPLTLATVWNIQGKIAWGLWGNSLEITRSDEKSAPSDITDVTTRTDVSSYALKLYLLDDLNYFVESKESKVGYQQSDADLKETANKNALDLQKAYNDYITSLESVRTLKNEITLRQRKLELLKKRNDLDEIPTVQLMEESWKYAETLSSYSRTLYTNYSAVTEMERMTLMPLR
jgi:outer membrane protein TolC